MLRYKICGYGYKNTKKGYDNRIKDKVKKYKIKKIKKKSNKIIEDMYTLPCQHMFSLRYLLWKINQRKYLCSKCDCEIPVQIILFKIIDMYKIN